MVDDLLSQPTAVSPIQAQSNSLPSRPPYSFDTPTYLSTMSDDIWLLQDLLPIGGAGVIYGDAKTGKSFAAIQLASAIAGGAPDWFDVPAVTTGKVLYVQLDTPQSLWKERLANVLEAGYDLSNINWADRDTFGTWPFDIALPEHAARLRAEVERINPIAVIIDTLKESNSINENDATEQQAAVARLVTACQPAALILISHAKKPQQDGPQGDVVNMMRGSNYVVGRMDAICQFTRKTLKLLGRAMEETSLKIKRTSCGTWEIDESDRNPFLSRVMNDSSLKTRSEKVNALIKLSAKSEEACRSAVRRAEKAAAAREKKKGVSNSPDHSDRPAAQASPVLLNQGFSLDEVGGQKRGVSSAP